MTLRQWEVLVWLSQNGELSQAELAECMGIERHTLTGVLARMERDGWLERRCCQEDRRKNKLRPTNKAEAAWSQAVACCQHVRAQAVEGIPFEELAQFKRTCETIRRNLAAAEDPELSVQLGGKSDTADSEFPEVAAVNEAD